MYPVVVLLDQIAVLVKAMVFPIVMYGKLCMSESCMWGLDYKESWVPKNSCFWTVVLEKTLESPLDWKEIHPVLPKGDQSWVFTGRTDVEAETSASVFSINIQGQLLLGLTVFISLLPKKLSGVFSSTKIWKHQFRSFHLQSCLGDVSRICISCRFPGEVNTGTHWYLALVKYQTNVIHWELAV